MCRMFCSLLSFFPCQEESGCLRDVLEFSTVGQRYDDRIRMASLLDLLAIKGQKLLSLLDDIVLLYEAFEAVTVHVYSINADMDQNFHTTVRA